MTTPNINALALPFKKRLVANSKQFRGIWAQKKEYVGRVGGKGASYHANKYQRRSEEWPWPESPSQAQGRGSSPSEEISAPKRSAPPERHFLEKMEELRTNLKEANTEITCLVSQVDLLQNELRDKQLELRRCSRQIVELERNAAIQNRQGIFRHNSLSSSYFFTQSHFVRPNPSFQHFYLYHC